MVVESQDHYWLRKALELAKYAQSRGEVPIGAVLVLQNEAWGEGYNCPITRCDPTAHAEIIAIRQAAERLGNYRLVGSTLYVTLEPCAMCAGAIIQARVQRVVYGASDLRAGAVTSVFNVLQSETLNHRAECVAGILEDDCRSLLQNFFRDKRNSKVVVPGNI